MCLRFNEEREKHNNKGNNAKKQWSKTEEQSVKVYGFNCLQQRTSAAGRGLVVYIDWIRDAKAPRSEVPILGLRLPRSEDKS